jgi:putative component of membrane protein insertase Oxa1/YidC/SpoIIIJ protein YidD
MPELLNKLATFILLLVGITLLSVQATFAQNKSTDLAYLQNATSDEAGHTYATPKKALKPILKYNPVYWFLNGSLTVYQKVISPQLSAGCIYETSCSRFSRLAISEFGIIKGIALTTDRLTRCNRITAAGINRDRFNARGLVIDEPSMYRF